MSEDQWRLFVGLPVPADVAGRIEAALAPVVAANDQHLRFTNPGTWHLTLAFLGATDPALVDVVERALTTAVAGQSAFEVRMGRAGRFGRGVLWLGLDDDAYASVVALGNRVRDALAAAGVGHDDKPLHPHLTLARPRDPSGRGVSRSRLAEVDEALAPHADDLRWTADQVVLWRSLLGRGPARHDPLTRHRLVG